EGDRVALTTSFALDGSNSSGNVETLIWGDDLRSPQSPDGFLQVTETASGTADSVAISDDGGTLAFTTGANLVGNGNPDGNSEVFTFDLDGGTGVEQQSFSVNGVNGAAELSGDGSTLYWHSNRNLNGDNPDLS